MAQEAGQRIGDYEVISLLGTGGMGRVYKVRNVISNREEAMKVLLPDFASDPELAGRFMAEIRTLGGLDHPNIAQLRTAFQLQNHFVMIMEYVEGTTLDKLPGQSGVQLDRVLDYAMQVLSALSYAHGKGVVHRDIKPANIMITSHGLVKLMDFGIAKSANEMNLTRPGTTMGSVYYMCPEQVRGGTVDARSDIYSFGVTLYEMLTGKKPFEADTSYSVLNAQLNTMPMPPGEVNPALPAQLNGIVLHAMAKDPNARFQTADDFRNALKALREHAAPEAVASAVGVGYAPVAPPTATAPTQVIGADAYAPSATQASAPAYAPVAATPAQGYKPVAAVPAGGYAPVAAAPAAVTPIRGKSNRGLWIGLGALAAVLALVAAATVLPRFFATHAGQKNAATSTDSPSAISTPNAGSTTAEGAPASAVAPQPDAAASSTAAATPGASAAANQPNAGSSASSGTASPKPRQPYNPSGQTPKPAGGQTAVVTPTPSVPAGPSPQEIRQARDRLMNLNARAEAAGSGVQQIRSQQQAQGLDLRGDILATMSRMKNFMREADQAIGQHDLQAADEYMDHADREVATLEKFLGR